MAKRIIWIEDDTPIIAPTVRPLKPPEYEITILFTVGEAFEAVEQIRSADLILLDMILPPGSFKGDMHRYPGLFVLRELRETYGIRTPVIAFTVVTRGNVRDELESLGAVVLNKPILPSELKAKIDEILAA